MSASSDITVKNQNPLERRDRIAMLQRNKKSGHRRSAGAGWILRVYSQIPTGMAILDMEAEEDES